MKKYIRIGLALLAARFYAIYYTGSPNHVGIVEKVKNGVIYVIEGNQDERVAVREVKINGKFIRGFVTPRFDTLAYYISEHVYAF